MDDRDWDEIWTDMDEGGHPDPLIADLVARVPSGRSIDLGCGLGQNVLALAGAGWEAWGADSSEVAMDKASSIAAKQGLDARFTVSDVAQGIPDPPYDLITMFYFHLETDTHRRLLGGVCDALTAGGTFLYVGHDETFATTHHGHMGDLEQKDGDEHHHEHGDHHGHRSHDDHDEDMWADREVGGPDRIASMLDGLKIIRADTEKRKIFHGPQEIDVTDVIVEAKKS